MDQLERESNLRNFANAIGINTEGLNGEEDLVNAIRSAPLRFKGYNTTGNCEVCGNHSNELRAFHRSYMGCVGAYAECPTCYGMPLEWEDD